MVEQGKRYETRTIKCVRGMESRTAARWEQDGWEVVLQEQGKLQSSLVVHRPVRRKSGRTIAIGGGAAGAMIVVIALGAAGVFGSESDQGQTGAASSADASARARATPNPAPSATHAESLVVVTAENTPAFAALLQLTDDCEPSISSFADEYKGRTVRFDGSIAAMNNHGSYTTRYDILIEAGDYSESISRGPAFQLQDVNTTSDMHYVGSVPDTIGTGTNLGIMAEVGQYNPQQCLLRLKPTETTVR